MKYQLLFILFSVSFFIALQVFAMENEEQKSEDSNGSNGSGSTGEKSGEEAMSLGELSEMGRRSEIYPLVYEIFAAKFPNDESLIDTACEIAAKKYKEKQEYAPLGNKDRMETEEQKELLKLLVDETMIKMIHLQHGAEQREQAYYTDQVKQLKKSHNIQICSILVTAGIGLITIAGIGAVIIMQAVALQGE